MKFIWQPAKNGCGKKKDSKESFFGLNEDAMVVADFMPDEKTKRFVPVGTNLF